LLQLHGASKHVVKGLVEHPPPYCTQSAIPLLNGLPAGIHNHLHMPSQYGARFTHGLNTMDPQGSSKIGPPPVSLQGQQEAHVLLISIGPLGVIKYVQPPSHPGAIVVVLQSHSGSGGGGVPPQSGGILTKSVQ